MIHCNPPVTIALFLDQLDAENVLIAWEDELQAAVNGPVQHDVNLHEGEGGRTTLYTRGGRLIAVSSITRDALNRSLLSTIDLREFTHD